MIFNLFTKKQRVVIMIGLVAALIGLGDSIYLTTAYFSTDPLVCNLLDGCNVVLTSSWSSFFGIPLAAFGVLYYTSLVLMLFWYLYRGSQLTRSFLLAVSTVGVVMSLGFLYLQIGVIGAVCEYCLLSLISSICVWGSVLALLRLQSKQDNEQL